MTWLRALVRWYCARYGHRYASRSLYSFESYFSGPETTYASDRTWCERWGCTFNEVRFRPIGIPEDKRDALVQAAAGGLIFKGALCLHCGTYIPDGAPHCPQVGQHPTERSP